jgi:hypothetical protein
MKETTRLNVPLMFDVNSEAVRCDRNNVLLLLTRDQHATSRRVIRVNNLWLVIKFYLRHGKFIICCRAWWLHESYLRKQSLKSGFLKPINTNIFDSLVDEIIIPRRCLYFRLTSIVSRIVSVFLWSVSNEMQRYTIFFIAVNTLHVSRGFPAHHQELKLYTQHLVYVMLACCLPLVWVRWHCQLTHASACWLYLKWMSLLSSQCLSITVPE